MSGIVVLEQNDLPYVWEETQITITNAAMQQFREACKTEGKPAIRIGVKGGGCSRIYV